MRVSKFIIVLIAGLWFLDAQITAIWTGFIYILILGARAMLDRKIQKSTDASVHYSSIELPGG